MGSQNTTTQGDPPAIAIEGDSIDNPIDLTRPPIMLRIPNPWRQQYPPSPPLSVSSSSFPLSSPSPSPEPKKNRLRLNPPKPHRDHSRQEYLLTDGAREQILRRARLEGRRELQRELGLEEDIVLAEDTVPHMSTRAASKDASEVERKVKREPST